MSENSTHPLVEPANAVTPPAASQTPPAPSQPLSQTDERTWGMLAHLSVLLNLITGLGGPIAALIIYIIYKDRSRRVAYNALQAMLFQLICWFGTGLLIGGMWAVVGALSAILIGIILIPFAVILTLVIVLLPVGSIIYGILGAFQVNQGQDFKYWLVGDWVRGVLTNP